MMDDDDFDDRIQTQQKESPPKRKFTPTNVAPAKKQKVSNVPNSIVPEEESDEEEDNGSFFFNILFLPFFLNFKKISF